MKLRARAKTYCVIKGREHEPGEAVETHVLSDRELAALVQAGTIEFGHAPAKEIPVEKMVMFRGRENFANGPGGIEYRCVPVEITEWHENEIRAGNRSYEKISRDAIYIGPGATIENFEKEILSALPRAPKVIFIRDNGAGDVIMSGAAAREFRRRVPDAVIVYATLPANMGLLREADWLDRVVSVHEMDLERGGYSLIVNWSRAVENYDLERNRGDRAASFAKHIGLGGAADLTPRYSPTVAEREFAKKFLGEKKTKIIGYAMRAAAWNRTWPMWRREELCGEILERLPGYRIMIVDGDPECGFEMDGVINASGATRSFGEAAALLEKCGAVVSQDSGLAHACGAMGVRTVVAMGSIPPETRYASYPSVSWIYPEGRIECCPCWDWHRIRESGELKGLPYTCHHTGRNICLESVRAGEIAEAVAEAVEGGGREQT